MSNLSAHFGRYDKQGNRHYVGIIDGSLIRGFLSPERDVAQRMIEWNGEMITIYSIGDKVPITYNGVDLEGTIVRIEYTGLPSCDLTFELNTGEQIIFDLFSLKDN